MGPLANTVFVRLTVVMLVAIVLFNLAMALALFAPFGRERARLALFPLPTQAAAIVDVIEATPAAEQARLLDALNSRALRVEVLDALPPTPREGPVAVVLARMFGNYDEVFADRNIHIELRQRSRLERALGDGESGEWEPDRIYIQLRDGRYLLLEPARGALFDTFLARGLAIMGVVGLLVIVGLFFAVRRTAKPIAALAANAESFAERLDAPDLPEKGPRELRNLARTMNAMKRRIRQLVDERTRMVAATTHDLRTYLTRLRLRIEFINDDDQRARAERDLEEMETLVNDTLLFARTSEGHADPNARTDLAAELRAMVGARAELNEDVTLPDPLPAGASARIEPAALRRVMSNLVENAVRYGERARVLVRAEAGDWVVAVEDDGPGIPEADLDRITAPFERLEPSRARNSGGAGLGLAIARALVEGQGGRLSLHNREDGGLCAEVRLRKVEV